MGKRKPLHQANVLFLNQSQYIMYYLIYSSKASDGMNETDLKQILAKAEEKNKKQNITGLLVYFNGTFIQMLEGKKEDVLETFERIEDDDRHE